MAHVTLSIDAHVSQVLRALIAQGGLAIKQPLSSASLIQLLRSESMRTDQANAAALAYAIAKLAVVNALMGTLVLDVVELSARTNAVSMDRARLFARLERHTA